MGNIIVGAIIMLVGILIGYAIGSPKPRRNIEDD